MIDEQMKSEKKEAMRRTIENAQSGDTQKSIDSQNATMAASDPTRQWHFLRDWCGENTVVSA